MSAALTFTLDEETVCRLDAAASARQVSREDIIRAAVSSFLSSDDQLPSLQAWQLQQIMDGIAAADNVEFASDEDVERIFAKYR